MGEVRELKQSYQELAAQLPGFESRRQAEADAVQAKLKSLVSKLDSTCSDIPDCKARGAGTTPAPADTRLDNMNSIQKLKDENLRFREQNGGMRENVPLSQRLPPGPKGVYRSTSAGDASRLLGAGRQQSFATQVSSGIAQRAANFTSSQPSERHGPGSSSC